VIGPVVAAAIIAGLAFWVWKLRRRLVKERTVYGGLHELDAHSPSVTQYYPQELPGTWQLRLDEAPDQPNRVELPGSPKELG
jgi:hypothetical protein